MIIADTLVGGLGAVAIEHTRRLRDQGHDVLFVVTSDGLPMNADRVSVRYTRPTDRLVSWSSLATMRDLRRLSREFRPSGVHVHGLRSFALNVSSHPRAVVTMHGVGVASGANSLSRCVRLALLSMVSMFPTAAISVVPGVPGRWIFVPHASPQLAAIVDDVSGPADSERPIFLWLSGFNRPKRPEFFVEVARRLGGRADFHMYGDGALKLFCEAAAADIPGLKILGSVGSVSQAIASCRALVLASFSEGVPFVLQEAMWAGRPVVTTPTRGIRWLTGLSGLMANTADEMARHCDGLLDGEIARIRGEASRAEVRSKLSVDSPWCESVYEIL